MSWFTSSFVPFVVVAAEATRSFGEALPQNATNFASVASQVVVSQSIERVPHHIPHNRRVLTCTMLDLSKPFNERKTSYPVTSAKKWGAFGTNGEKVYQRGSKQL